MVMKQMMNHFTKRIKFICHWHILPRVLGISDSITSETQRFSRLKFRFPHGMNGNNENSETERTQDQV